MKHLTSGNGHFSDLAQSSARVRDSLESGHSSCTECQLWAAHLRGILQPSTGGNVIELITKK
jgi:hypothetical protein